MSYHEINLPSQNDLRYKYTGMINNKGITSSKSETPEGLKESRKLTPEIASLFASSKQDTSFQSFDSKYNSTEKKIPTLLEMQKTTKSKSMTEAKVPTNT